MRRLIQPALWLFAHTALDVRIVGRQNIPQRGPALLVSNHISYADGFLIAYCVKPMVRFLAWTPFFGVPGVGLILRTIRAIPVGLGGRTETMEAIARARRELSSGGVVCIFPEGSMTRDGAMQSFKRGIEKIVEGIDVPVVPVHIDGLWGTLFSVEGDEWVWRRARCWRCPVSISFGASVPPSSRAMDVREAILQLAARRVKKLEPTAAE